MKKAFALSALCTLLFLLMTGSALAQIVPGCTLADDETSRIDTARALVDLTASNYSSVINYWADDIVYKDPFLTNNGRQEMLDYLDGYYSGSIYGWPTDKAVTIKDELVRTYPDGSMTYLATIEWTGTSPVGFYFQTGMSILKFAPGEGCPYYHRDYWSEADNWYQVPAWNAEVAVMRGVYINIMLLTGRCFDDDQDGYTKYAEATGCPNPELDCNDFTADINPGATEIPGNGVDDDCNPGTPD
jgi:hypothetical protein